jgi:hypothetical protein
MRRTRVLVSIAVFAAIMVAAATGWRLATRQRPAPTEDVREVMTAYLADQSAARDKYSDALVTASGVVRWSARTDEVTTHGPGERSPQLDELSKQATVLIIVDGRHVVLADFSEENQREAMALREGEQVTIRGRHSGFFTGVMGDGNVILSLNGCEFVR